MSTEEFPRSQCSSRPFHLWDVNEKKAVRWRYFADKKRAHNAALIEARWAKVGGTIEVFNSNTGKLLGQYTRREHTVQFLNGDR